jgi:hypothetical protein
MINQIKSLALPANSAFRTSVPLETNVFTQVLKCYQEMYSQLTDETEHNLCRVLSVNYRILTIFKSSPNFLKMVVYDKSLMNVVAKEIIANTPTSTSFVSAALTTSAQTLYDIFVQNSFYTCHSNRLTSSFGFSAPL